MGKPDATHEEIIEAAKAAACHDFIMALPDGYQTIVGEGGSTLSGGEKQRISIARAILKDAPIILLDEATASLDPRNEVLIQQAISALVEEKTVIVIAHRLQSICNADNIIVLEKDISQNKERMHSCSIRMDCMPAFGMSKIRPNSGNCGRNRFFHYNSSLRLAWIGKQQSKMLAG